jgi:hypothetical protein
MITASMAFPSIGPVRLRTTKCQAASNCGIDLVDGGIADNLGFWTAVELVQADLLENVHRKGLIIVLDSTLDAESGLVSNAAVPTVGEYIADLGVIGVNGQNPNTKQQEAILEKMSGSRLRFVHLSVRDLFDDCESACAGNEVCESTNSACWVWERRCHTLLPENGLPYLPSAVLEDRCQDWRDKPNVFGSLPDNPPIEEHLTMSQIQSDIDTNAALKHRLAFAIGQLGRKAVERSVKDPNGIKEAFKVCMKAPSSP